MPELPEVETVLQSILPRIQNSQITTVKVLHPQIVGYPDSPLSYAKKVCGEIIRGGYRRGKIILFSLNQERKLVFHLRMTGRLGFLPGKRAGLLPHTHLILTLDSGESLFFADTRRFGRTYLIAPGEEEKAGNLSRLGWEPLSSDFTAEKMQEVIGSRKGRIKCLLLNQKIIAGLGNIYVDEILFRSFIHPQKRAVDLSFSEIKTIHTNMRLILREAIDKRGTTFRDYRDGEGNSGNFQEFLQVYGKGGQACPHCEAKLIRKKIGGRSTVFCPLCQRKD